MVSKHDIVKALSKQVEPNVFWDAYFLNPSLNFTQLPGLKKNIPKIQTIYLILKQLHPSGLKSFLRMASPI